MNLSLAQNDHLLDNSTATINLSRNATTVLSMFSGLAAFEILNYATTAFALQSLLGSFTVMGFNLAAWLAAAVCCLDVSGIIYLFLPLERPIPLKKQPPFVHCLAPGHRIECLVDLAGYLSGHFNSSYSDKPGD